MTRYPRGLVIGKFYPPHRGHHRLIRVAAQQVDHLDVIVCWKEEQRISGDQRAGWLRTVHSEQCNVRVRTVWDFGDDENSEAWAQCCLATLGHRPDVVFTSEDYGPRFAHCLGAQHVMVDRERRQVPISSTAVRADPLSHWDFLETPTRACYALRVAVVGAESSGTTTLARALAEHYRTDWVPEYAREYCERFINEGEPLAAHRWRTEEFTHIAKEQIAREEHAAGRCNRLLICDTEALATSVWHERYMGWSSETLAALATPQKYALYVLTNSDFAFVQDGLRDGEAIRPWMTTRFEHALKQAGVNWILACGDHEFRMRAVTEAIDALLKLLKPVPRIVSTSISSRLELD